MKIFYHFLFLLLFIGCASPQKLVDNHQYERALELSTQRLKYGKAKWKHLNAFEKSFRALTMADSMEIRAMRAEGRPELWPIIYDKAVAISNRQHKVTPVLNKLYDSDMEPVVSLYPVSGLIKEAAEKSALYYYAGALEHLENARNGNRQAARESYYLLERCRYYLANYKDAPALQQEMYELGTTHILIAPLVDAFDPRFEYDLLEEVMGPARYPLRIDWQVFHRDPASVDKPHYLAELKMYDLYVSGNNCDTKRCSNTESIEVGTKEVEVWNESDSTWVIEKEPVYEDVCVRVRTYHQEKSASLRMHYSIVDAETDEEIIYQSLCGSNCWSNTYSRVSGDRRALSSDCDDLGGSELAFPYDSGMLLGAAYGIRAGFYNQLKRAVD